MGRLRVNWDLTKNICELYTTEGQLTTTYTYTPYGTVTADGDVDQAIQWSSEFNDTELGLVYYNFRYYNPTDGRWTRRDPIGINGGMNLYGFVGNRVLFAIDELGLAKNFTCTKNGESFDVNTLYALSYGLFPVNPDDSEIISDVALISKYIPKLAARQVPVLRMTAAVFRAPELADALIKASGKNRDSGRMVVYCKIFFIVCKEDCSGKMKKISDNTGYASSGLVLPDQVEEGMNMAKREAERIKKKMIKKIIGKK